jgi:hypothetical protein
MDQSNAKVHMETKECIEVKIGQRDADFQAKQQEVMLLYVAVRLLGSYHGQMVLKVYLPKTFRGTPEAFFV